MKQRLKNGCPKEEKRNHYKPHKEVLVKKERSLSKYKKDAWNLLSKIIRLYYADKDGNCRCVTCGKKVPWSAPHAKGAQAGHFIDGRGSSILFVRIGIHPQCYSCNIKKHGNKVEYYSFMLKKYGQSVINHLRTLKHQTLKITREEYKEMIVGFKKELKELEKNGNRR